MSKTYKIDGKEYIPVIENYRNSCSGCSAEDDNSSCNKLSHEVGCNGTIFIARTNEEINEETNEETFTTSEVKALVHCIINNKEDVDDAFDRFIAKRKLISDPEYIKYLELKKKYEVELL